VKEALQEPGDFTFFCGKVNENHQMRKKNFVHHAIVSAIKKVEFVSGRMSCIGRWCNIIFLNEHAPTGEKTDDSKYSNYEGFEEIIDHFRKCHTKILSADFNAKLGREGIFKLTIGNESLSTNGNDNGVRVVNFALSKNLVVKSKIFPH
jgi:hypothetical protein